MIQKTTAAPPVETNAEYHADLSHYSHSMLEKYRTSPALFERLYVSKTIPLPPSTPAMVMGSLVHCLVLEPEEFERLYLVAEGCSTRRGNAWKSAVDAAEAMGVECILRSQVDEAQCMADAVAKHPVAARLLAIEGINEQAIRWEDENGTKLKCKPDRLITNTSLDNIICVDLKTSLHPQPDRFAKDAVNYGYHRQASHYTGGCTVKHGRPCNMVYIVVGKESPHDVFVYQPDEVFISHGWAENAETLADMRASFAMNEWLAPNQNQLITLELPTWARR